MQTAIGMQAFDPYSHAVSSNIITDRVEGFLHVEKMLEAHKQLAPLRVPQPQEEND